MSKLGEVGARSRAMGEDGEVGLRSRRSARLIKKEVRASDEALILYLKKEKKVLIDRRKKEDEEWWALKNGKSGKEAQPAGAGKDRTAAEETQMAGAGKKRKKVVKSAVPQELINYMIVNPHKPWNGFPEEDLRKRSQKFRDYYAREKAVADLTLEYHQALIKQFRTKGSAYDYTEVTDEEDEVTDKDEKN